MSAPLSLLNRALPPRPTGGHHQGRRRDSPRPPQKKSWGTFVSNAQVGAPPSRAASRRARSFFSDIEGVLGLNVPERAVRAHNSYASKPLRLPCPVYIFQGSFCASIFDLARCRYPALEVVSLDSCPRVHRCPGLCGLPPVDLGNVSVVMTNTAKKQLRTIRYFLPLLTALICTLQAKQTEQRMILPGPNSGAQ